MHPARLLCFEIFWLRFSLDGDETWNTYKWTCRLWMDQMCKKCTPIEQILIHSNCNSSSKIIYLVIFMKNVMYKWSSQAFIPAHLILNKNQNFTREKNNVEKWRERKQISMNERPVWQSIKVLVRAKTMLAKLRIHICFSLGRGKTGWLSWSLEWLNGQWKGKMEKICRFELGRLKSMTQVSVHKVHLRWKTFGFGLVLVGIALFA